MAFKGTRRRKFPKHTGIGMDIAVKVEVVRRAVKGRPEWWTFLAYVAGVKEGEVAAFAGRRMGKGWTDGHADASVGLVERLAEGLGMIEGARHHGWGKDGTLRAPVKRGWGGKEALP